MCLLLIFSGVSLAQASQVVRSDSLSTEVIVIGTIHDAHNTSPYYNTRDLKRILLKLRPDALLIEIPENQMGKDGRVREQDRVGPEIITADEVASELHIPQIPFDHPKRNENNSQLLGQWNEIQPRIAQLNQDIKSKHSLDLQFISLYDLANAGLQSTQTRATATAVNSEACDALTSIWYSILQDILLSLAEDYRGYDDLVPVLKHARDWWHERNTAMADNIMKAAKAYAGRRLVIMTGSAHRYILRDLLKKQQGIVLKEFWEVLTP
jgi:hypothetical protein